MEDFTGRGQRRAVGGPAEQDDVQFFLQKADRVADGGLRFVQPFRRAAERAGSDNCIQGKQLFVFHGILKSI